MTYEQIYSNSRMTTMIQDMYLPGEGDVYSMGTMTSRQ